MEDMKTQLVAEVSADQIKDVEVQTESRPALVMAMPISDNEHVDEGEDAPTMSTAMKCRLRCDGCITNPLTQYCCLVPVPFGDIVLLYFGFRDMEQDSSAGKMCGVSPVNLGDFTMVAGSVGFTLFLLAFVLSTARKVLTGTIAEKKDDESKLMEWMDFWAFILTFTSVPKMVFALMGILVYYFMSTECQSSDLGLVIMAWSVFNGLIGTIDIVGIIKNWNHLKGSAMYSFHRSKSETSIPKKE